MNSHHCCQMKTRAGDDIRRRASRWRRGSESSVGSFLVLRWHCFQSAPPVWWPTWRSPPASASPCQPPRISGRCWWCYAWRRWSSLRQGACGALIGIRNRPAPWSGRTSLLWANRAVGQRWQRERRIVAGRIASVKADAPLGGDFAAGAVIPDSGKSVRADDNGHNPLN